MNAPRAYGELRALGMTYGIPDSLRYPTGLELIELITSIVSISVTTLTAVL